MPQPKNILQRLHLNFKWTIICRSPSLTIHLVHLFSTYKCVSLITLKYIYICTLNTTVCTCAQNNYTFDKHNCGTSKSFPQWILTAKNLKFFKKDFLVYKLLRINFLVQFKMCEKWFRYVRINKHIVQYTNMYVCIVN